MHFSGFMHLVVEKVPPFGRDVKFTASASQLNGDGEPLVSGSAQVDGRAEPKRRGGLQVSGSIVAVLDLACSRCLKRFEQPQNSHFDVIFSASPLVEAEDEIELAPGDLMVRPLEGDRVDMVELVREQLLLEVPIAPLCDDACPGLCRHCGADLNLGDCACNEAVDPRFAALKKLL